ncbi:MAG: PT domain-containing protein, partial [Chloroflexota bacterium]
WDILADPGESFSSDYQTDWVSKRNGANPIAVYLSAGRQTITFYARENETRLDKVTLINSNEPTPVPTVEPTLEPTPIPTLEPTLVPTLQPTLEPTPTPTQPPIACGGLSQEAEDGELFGLMQLVAGGSAVGGTGVEHGTLFAGDRADYCVTITEAKEYAIQAVVKAPTDGSNSMYWTVDGLPSGGMVWHMSYASSGFTTQYVSEGGSFNGGNPAKGIYLEPGTYTLSFYLREPGVELDRFELVDKPDDPQPDDFDAFNFPKIDYANVGLANVVLNYTNEIKVTSTSKGSIQAAIDSVKSTDPPTKIIIAAGVHEIDTLRITRSNIMLVGEENGCGRTILRFDTDDDGIRVTGGGGTGYTSRLTADAAYNTNALTVANAGGFSVNDYVWISQDDDPDLFRLDLSINPDEDWSDDNAIQINKITAINGNTLTLEGGLNLNFKTAENAQVEKINDMISGVGIENLTLERTASDNAIKETANIYFNYAANSWVNGVHSKNAVRAHVYFNRSYKGEVRGSYLDGSFNHGEGGHGYGVLLEHSTTDMLVENNIGRFLRHSFVVQIGGNGNVFAYNYSIDPYGYHIDDDTGERDFGEIYADLSTHGSFTFSNLFEGNQAQVAKSDNVHASNSWNFFFRNRLEQDAANYTYGEELLRLDKGKITPHLWVHDNQYYNTLLANETSFPGADPDTNTVNSGRDNLTICKNNDTGRSTNGCQRTRATTRNHGNYDHFSGQTVWDSSISEQNFPDSAYLGQTPDFWDSSAWPPFGPDTIGSVAESDKIIPAKSRFLNGQSTGNSSDYCYVGN